MSNGVNIANKINPRTRPAVIAVERIITFASYNALPAPSIYDVTIVNKTKKMYDCGDFLINLLKHKNIINYAK